jgi:hypothetical protein
MDKKQIKFSPSRYNVQRDCLGKYYFRHILKVPVKSKVWPGTVYGTTLHLFVEENLSVLKKKDIKKDIVKSFLDCWIESKEEAINKGDVWSLPRGYKEDEYLKEGEKWALKVLKHLHNWLPKDSVKVHEEQISFEIEVENVTILFNSIIDLQIKNNQDLHIIDLKTTKHSQGFYFVDWNTDPQSLSYLYAKKDENPKSFGYCVFNRQDEMIFFNSRGDWRKEEEGNFMDMIVNFITFHDSANDTSQWSPEETKCKWCDYNKLCKVKK